MAQINRRIIKIPAGIFLVICFFVIVSGIVFLRGSVVNDDHGVRYTVPAGASIRSVTQDLYALNIIRHPVLFDLLVNLEGNRHELKAGEYLFPKGTTPLSLLYQITHGTGMYHYSFTFIAGWNFRHLRDMLEKEPDLQHTSALMSDTAIMTYLGESTMSPEGRFFPDTYFFTKGSSDLLLLKRAFQKMQKTLNAAWQTRELGLPYDTQNEALIVASLVEKETGLARERPMIAGVIVNRLRKNMLLQIDPTVIYAAGANYDGTIYKKDLLSDNPYNTYKHKGLPPTPIAIPGLESINAALHPQHHGYYYFVAKNNSAASEGHQFSATLVEHNTAVTIAHENQIWMNNELISLYFVKTLGPIRDITHAK